MHRFRRRTASLGLLAALSFTHLAIGVSACDGDGDDALSPSRPDASLDSGPDSTATDAGGDGPDTRDATASDAGSDGQAPDSALDGATPPGWVSADGLPMAILNDGHVLVVTPAVHVVAAGTSPVALDDAGRFDSYGVALGDSFMAAEHYCHAVTGALHFWSVATGPRTLTTRMPPCGGPVGAISRDGRTLAFIDGTGEPIGRLVVQHADGTGTKVLFDDTQCIPTYGFLANGDVLAAFCDPGADSGGATRRIARFAAPSYARTDLATDVQPPSRGGARRPDRNLGVRRRRFAAVRRRARENCRRHSRSRRHRRARGDVRPKRGSARLSDAIGRVEADADREPVAGDDIVGDHTSRRSRPSRPTEGG